MLASSASSSAVTIPTPGKSILKRPPPPQQSFFSLARLSKLLPNQQTPAAQDEASTLKRAHFILPEMTVVYPISAANPPSTPSMKEEKKSIEEREMERRRRILRGGTSISSTDGDECWWSLDQVESFYRECCVGREEAPDPGVSLAFKVSLPLRFLRGSRYSAIPRRGWLRRQHVGDSVPSRGSPPLGLRRYRTDCCTPPRPMRGYHPSFPPLALYRIRKQGCRYSCASLDSRWCPLSFASRLRVSA